MSIRISKGDIVSAGVTVAIAGIGYFVSGPHLAYGCIAAGAAIILIAHFIRDKEPEPPLVANLPLTSTPKTKTGDVNVGDFRSGGTKTGDINFAPVIQVGTVQPTLTPPPTPRPVRERPPEPKSNISFKNVRPAWIWYSEEDRCFVEVQDRHHGWARAVIARFKNESAAYGASAATSIRAELVLRDVNEQELEHGVHAACWLREATDTVDFSVGEDHWVLLGASDRKDNNSYWVVPWKQIKQSWEGTWYELEGHLVSGMRSVEIRLIGESDRWVTKPVVIDIVVNDGEPTVAVRPPVK